MLVLTTAFALMASTTAVTAHKQVPNQKQVADQAEDESLVLGDDLDENFEEEGQCLEIVFDDEFDAEDDLE